MSNKNMEAEAEAMKRSYTMQLQRFERFKAQDPQHGGFDVTFEIDSKQIFAHKSIIEPVSDTMETMLSDRWTSTDAPITLTTYTYEEFYEFLTFIYSGKCEINEGNVITMIDMAEFYHVQTLMEYTDDFLSDLRLSSKNIFTLIDIVTKFNMEKFKNNIDDYLSQRYATIVRSPDFILQEKRVIEYIVAAKHSATAVKTSSDAEKLFEAVLKWADIQVTQQQDDDKNGNGNFNREQAIKDLLASMMHNFAFNRMKHEFVCSVVVPKSFLFSSSDELAKVLLENLKTVTVKYTNANQRAVSASFLDTFGVYDSIQWCKNNNKRVLQPRSQFILAENEKFSYFAHDLNLPIPCALTKNDNVKYYYVCENKELLKIKMTADLQDDDYLIAEMDEDAEFYMTKNGEIEVSRNY